MTRNACKGMSIHTLVASRPPPAPKHIPGEARLLMRSRGRQHRGQRMRNSVRERFLYMHALDQCLLGGTAAARPASTPCTVRQSGMRAQASQRENKRQRRESRQITLACTHLCKIWLLFQTEAFLHQSIVRQCTAGARGQPAFMRMYAHVHACVYVYECVCECPCVCT